MCGIDAGFFVRHGLALPAPADLLACMAVLVLGLLAFRHATTADLRTVTTHPLATTLACLTILLPLYHMAYDTLLLADVHAAIAYYLRHKGEVQAYLKRRAAEAETLRARIEAEHSRITPEELIARRSARENADAPAGK